MVSEAVEESSGKPFKSKDLGPFVEGQVGCHQDRPSLVTLTEHFKEQFRPNLGQRHEAQFVNDQKLETCQPSLQVEQTPFVPGLDQFVDKGGCGSEAHGQSTLACSKTETEGNMGLAGSAVAESDDVLVALDVLTPGQLQHQSLIEGRHRQEVEGVEALGRWEAGRFDTDRDLTVRCMSQGHDYQKCRVSDHMSGPAITVGPASDMLDAAAMMAGRKIRRLPVVDGDKLIGLVSLSDIALSIDSALVSMTSTLHDLLSGMGAARST